LINLNQDYHADSILVLCDVDNKPESKNKFVNISESNVRVSTNVIRLVGYGLLVLWLFDFIATFIPPKFTDPAWEFQTIGRLVESSGWVLIAFAMIFFGEDTYRLRLELPLLKGLSWLCLVFAILYFAMLPLGLANTWRLRNRNDVQAGAVLAQRTTPLNEVQTRLKNSNSDQELLELYKKLVPPNTPLTVKDPQETKTKLLAEINTSTIKIKQELDAARDANFKALVKNSVKWNLGTLLCAVLFTYLWRFSGFYRNLRPEVTEEW